MEAVTDAACWFADKWGKGATIVDLGSSRGSALAPIVDRVGAAGRYAAYEISDPMLAVLHERFGGWEKAGLMDVRKWDLRDGYPTGHGPAVAALLVLTPGSRPHGHTKLTQGVYETSINNMLTG